MSLGACSLVAIARNEGPYILEWLAYHLVVGFERIMVFDHRSSDETARILDTAAALDGRISRIPWRPREDIAPQWTAYNHALPSIGTPWVAFLDIDEFVVPWRHGRIDRFLAGVADDVSAVHVNWRTFGSAGRITDDYGLVTETFDKAAPPHWYGQCHYKSFARTDRIAEVGIHHVLLRSGRRVMSDMQDLRSTTEGIADRIAYEGIQVNHYQAKTWPEFERRMAKGRADAPKDHPEQGIRIESAAARFAILDRNEEADDRIAPFIPELRRRMSALSGRVPAGRRLRALAGRLLPRRGRP